MNSSVDVAVIGAGPAGVAAGIGAREAGAENVVVLERDWDLGGILQQCIHPGFGLHTFQEELTGPEYMDRWIRRAHDAGVHFRKNAMVFSMEESGALWVMNPGEGISRIEAGAVVLAMGCRERPLGAIRIPGTRPAGIYTAGTAQRFVNMEGYMPGHKAVILGSGDIGLIMARRLIWEGAQVEGVYEVMPWAGGLRRNISQCLHDFNIPFHLGQTVTAIHGNDRLEGVTVARVDEKMAPLRGTERFVECDTLLLAVGLIPENELSRMAGVEMCPGTGGPWVNELYETSKPGIFAAGNVVLVYDLADWVSQEGYNAGRNAALHAAGALPKKKRSLAVRGSSRIRLFSPQRISGAQDCVIYFRVKEPLEKPCRITASSGLYEKRVRYVRPGEMNEIPLEARAVRALGEEISEIVIDVEEV